jgi:hypothetical protein
MLDAIEANNKLVDSDPNKNCSTASVGVAFSSIAWEALGSIEDAILLGSSGATLSS